MTPLEITIATRHVLVLALMFVSPFLGAGLLVGVLVSLFQAGTRMNDMTLHFVPRFIAVLLMVALAGSWIGSRLVGFFQESVVQAAGDRY